MNIQYIPFADTAAFSHNDNAYISLDERLDGFYEHPPTLEQFDKVIDLKSKQPIDRNRLVDLLEEQYLALLPHAQSKQQLELLRQENSYTIITAHQPSLFTGPLYYIYKIVSAINLSNQLNEAYPSYNFIPIFWSGGEDHDFDEINHVKIFREKLVWESGETGSVGSMSNEHIQTLILQLQEILGEGQHAERIIELLKNSFGKHDKYGMAALELTHQLFADKGLIVIDTSKKGFKEIAKDIFAKEILERPSESLIQKAQERLVNKGLKAQAYPRPINLFYTGDGFRKRLDYQDGKYIVVDTDIVFSESEILADLNRHPERYSPNVVLRPLYQECILPNLAYIGGGGELAYWLERKEQFKEFDIPYPMLIRRDSVLWIDKGSQKKMKKLGFDVQSIWEKTDNIIQNIAKEIIDEEMNISHEKDSIKTAFDSLSKKIKEIDPTLQKAAQAELAKTMKGLEQLMQKAKRAEKRKHETTFNQIKNLKEKLFPSGSLQERKDNFIPFYLKHGDAYFDMLFEYLNPLDRRVKIILED